MGTIDDYMHEGNGQKSEHPQRDDPEVLKPAGLWSVDDDDDDVYFE